MLPRSCPSIVLKLEKPGDAFKGEKIKNDDGVSAHVNILVEYFSFIARGNTQ